MVPAIQKRTLTSVALLVGLSLMLGLGSNVFRTQPLPLFEPLPSLFPGELSLKETFRHFRQKDATLWDVRSSEAYERGHLPGALPVDRVPQKGKLIIVYCSSRLCPKAQDRAGELRSKGYREVLVMPDGIKGWHAAGYPIASSKP